MVNIAKKLFTVSIAFLLAGAFCFADEVLSESASSSNSSSSSTSSDFSKNIKSLEGHRFIEVRGAFPVFPALTSHGAVQSFVVGFADLFGAAFTPHDKFEATTPKFIHLSQIIILALWQVLLWIIGNLQEVLEIQKSFP